MRIQLSEVLKEINDDMDTLGTKYRGNRAIFTMFKYSLNPDWKFNLPEGEILYPDLKHLTGYSPVNLYLELLGNKLDIFCRKDLTPAKMNQLYKDLVTQLDVNDIQVLTNIKDQTLYNLFPKLTKANILPYYENK